MRWRSQRHDLRADRDDEAIRWREPPDQRHHGDSVYAGQWWGRSSHRRLYEW